MIVKQAAVPPQLDAIYETDMAEGLKAMAIEGHGLAFSLPASSVKELKASVCLASPPSRRASARSRWRCACTERPELARRQGRRVGLPCGSSGARRDARLYRKPRANLQAARP